ncbi:MAG: imidazolonepropionase [Thiotrichales bacterium]|nr:imidazolonepropionase [Thiotrichales bacterium]
MSPETPQFDRLWSNATVATMTPGGVPYGLLERAAIGIRDGRISWVGPAAELPPSCCDAATTLDCGQQLVTPGLIDCHTHLVYAGNRAREFEMRLNGATYEELSRAGGGINSTVSSTRGASVEALVDLARPRVERLMQDGVTTVEIKSGYGLTTADELKMLQAARLLGNLPVTVKTSFLGAHALPPEYANDKDGYIDLVCHEMLPAVIDSGLADAVDGFCEGIAFDVAQMERVFDVAQAAGLPIKLHAEQLSDLNGAAMAARRGALSVDHLEYLSHAGVNRLVENSTVAVLLPGAFFCLRETQLPPIEALRQAGVPIALASDQNPGSSPVGSLTLMLGMGCTLFQLTPEESLAGVTRHAAQALGLAADIGTIETGKRADLVLWQVNHPAELSYRLGDLACQKVLYGGCEK